MYSVLIGISILAICGLIVLHIIKKDEPKKHSKVHIKSERAKEKKLEKVRYFIEHHDEKITNNMIEKLGVSDSTAERYLDELEHEGLIHQVGKTGRGTYYEKNKDRNN